MIHPTAIIHPSATVDPSASIGPHVVIDQGVTLGAGCRVAPHVYITGGTRIGRDNSFHAGCVIGDAPQDLKYRGEPTELWIGDGNTFREHVTVHRSAKPGEATKIGSGNYLMANCHVGHNAHIGDHAILANGALIAGHASVGDRAFLSGNCLVHQFTRVGSLALMQGGAGISKDLPPFTIARGVNAVCGLNVIGLRRAGLSPDDRLELKQLYRRIFQSGLRLKEAVSTAGMDFVRPASQQFLAFIVQSKRGVCSDSSVRNGKRGGDLEAEGGSEPGA